MAIKTQSELKHAIATVINQINTRAEAARQRHITSGTGQALVYAEKVSQAVDFVSRGRSPNLDSYPFIKIESDATKKSPKVVADKILERHTHWMSVALDIEAIRLKGILRANRARSHKRLKLVQGLCIKRLDKI